MDESVQLAYSRSVFVDQAGRPWGLRSTTTSPSCRPCTGRAVTSRLPTTRCRVISVVRTPPNVSSAIFRKPDLAPLFAGQQLPMKICGDWIFYLHVLKGGKVAFSTDTSNYFRFHDSNSSAKTHDPDLLQGARGGRPGDCAALQWCPRNAGGEPVLRRTVLQRNATALIASGRCSTTCFDSERVQSARSIVCRTC